MHRGVLALILSALVGSVVSAAAAAYTPAPQPDCHEPIVELAAAHAVRP